MTDAEARAALADAVHRRDATRAAWDEARDRLHLLIRETSGTLRQVDIAKLTGYTRERIRQITNS